MFGELHYDAERPSPAGARAEQPDDVGVVDLLEEGVLGEQVVHLLAAVVRLQHLHCHVAVACNNNWENLKMLVV